MKTDNELIEDFYVSMGGKPTLKEDLSFYESDYNMLMDVLEAVHKSKHYKPYFTNELFGVEFIIKSNFCHIYLPDTSQGYDYLNDCYEAPDLFSMVNSRIEGGTIRCVYNTILAYIKWYNTETKI
jgi:hypothetical protein